LKSDSGANQRLKTKIKEKKEDENEGTARLQEPCQCSSAAWAFENPRKASRKLL